MKDRVKVRISKSKTDVFLRGDFNLFGNYRQVSRVLAELEKEAVLIRVGHGIYVKPCSSSTEQLEVTLSKIKKRLGKRVNRLITIWDRTIQLGKVSNKPNAQSRLDAFKLRLAKKVLSQFSMEVIRQKSLANITRWTGNGAWCSAFDEWMQLMEAGSDQDVMEAMSGLTETANRLRQSAPYTGLLDQSLVAQLRAPKLTMLAPISF
ncbi:MAG: DUF6088 family protein [Burkholderiaceae bacterium]